MKIGSPRSMRALSALPWLLLLAYGIAFAAAAIGSDAPSYDDHPGRISRIWHALRVGISALGALLWAALFLPRVAGLRARSDSAPAASLNQVPA